MMSSRSEVTSNSARYGSLWRVTVVTVNGGLLFQEMHEQLSNQSDWVDQLVDEMKNYVSASPQSQACQNLLDQVKQVFLTRKNFLLLSVKILSNFNNFFRSRWTGQRCVVSLLLYPNWSPP